MSLRTSVRDLITSSRCSLSTTVKHVESKCILYTARWAVVLGTACCATLQSLRTLKARNVCIRSKSILRKSLSTRMSLNSKSERSYKAALLSDAPKERGCQGGTISKSQREAPSGAPLTQPTKPKPREQPIGSPAPNTPSSSFTTPTNTESSAREALAWWAG